LIAHVGIPRWFVDRLGLPLTFAASCWLKLVRRLGLGGMPASRRVFRMVGLLPIADHFYEPLFNPKHLYRPLSLDRDLPGVDLNSDEQLALLSRFTFQDELKGFSLDEVEGSRDFYYRNPMFGSGDAEYLYSLIRLLYPRRVYEVGSGYSTRMVRAALEVNRRNRPSYECDHVCIEPYANSWLEDLGVRVERQRVELMDLDLFEQLEEDDVLFIDSSHIIRPQGDLLTLFLRVLPRLKRGVLIHIHDIFTPRDYKDEWVNDEIRLWNEQYLLEALISCSSSFEVVGALNYLQHHHPVELSAALPVLGSELAERECGSFWMRKH
jgi:predicted O-methyltransferase YrrM